MHQRRDIPGFAAQAERTQVFYGRLVGSGLAVGLSLITSLALARSLSNEASSLRAKLLSNAAALTSVVVENEISIQMLDGSGAPASAGLQTSHESVVWDKTAKKLHWRSTSLPPRAYVADGKGMTLAVVGSAGATEYESGLSDDKVAPLATPFPAWLWRPDQFVPETPVSIRADGSALVVTTSKTNPIRSIWLDRETGFILKFTETDATGRTVRVVTCDGWSSVSGVSLPASVTETITGRRNGMRRVVRFGNIAVNTSIAPGEFCSVPGSMVQLN